VLADDKEQQGPLAVGARGQASRDVPIGPAVPDPTAPTDFGIARARAVKARAVLPTTGSAITPGGMAEVRRFMEQRGAERSHAAPGPPEQNPPGDGPCASSYPRRSSCAHGCLRGSSARLRFRSAPGRHSPLRRWNVHRSSTSTKLRSGVTAQGPFQVIKARFEFGHRIGREPVGTRVWAT